jgi:hypothetical protein
VSVHGKIAFPVSVHGNVAFPVSVHANLIKEHIDLYHDASIFRNCSSEMFECFTLPQTKEDARGRGMTLPVYCATSDTPLDFPLKIDFTKQRHHIFIELHVLTSAEFSVAMLSARLSRRT